LKAGAIFTISEKKNERMASAVPPQLQRVLEAPDLVADDVVALHGADDGGAEAKALAINEAKHALQHLAKSVAVLSSRCSQGARIRALMG